jgi:hypothetical protein
MSETTINPTVERPHGGMGGGLPLLALPLLLAGAVFAFTQELPIVGGGLMFLFLLVGLRLLFAAAERGLRRSPCSARMSAPTA